MQLAHRTGNAPGRTLKQHARRGCLVHHLLRFTQRLGMAGFFLLQGNGRLRLFLTL